MPGLKQLEKFSEDIKKIGDEEVVRAKRGERLSYPQIPGDVDDKDDSDEFISGLPSGKEATDGESAGESAAQDDEDILSSLLVPSDGGNTGDGAPVDDGQDVLGSQDGAAEENPLPDDDDVLGGLLSGGEDGSGTDDMDAGSEDFPGTDGFEEFLSDGGNAEVAPADDGEPVSPAADDELGSEMSPDEGEAAPEFGDAGAAGADEIPDGEFADGAGADGSSADGASDPMWGEEGAGEEFHMDDFDPDVMENINFAGDDGEEFPVTGSGSDDDFMLSDADEFEIPGVTDSEFADLGKKSVDVADFSKAVQKPKNSLTEEEYERFKKNLSEYPLNLRVIIEDFISKDDSSAFTDEAIFEIIEKILKRTSARQIAAQLEKMLDISIDIPRDFEHRSYEQYEAYKSSFQYQLKNRIIPAALAFIVVCVVALGLFKAGQQFIYKPVMAEINYRQGYEHLQNNEYPLSEEKFDKAVSYRPKKKWFFKYASGYREHKQYERAALMYRKILGFFNYDKRAGLEYAEMELYDRADYAKAEAIVRRYVLDNHLNDPDGELLLGDIFLEWAYEDPSKFEDALEFYNDLKTRFPKSNLYLSRMLRYYIRTDQLRNVLVYKGMFYPKKNSLSAADWTELSGYLLDKLYGKLSKNDEYLRASIEDVRSMLEIAVNLDPSAPVGRYNLARYFIHNGYTAQAKSELLTSISLFDKQKVRTKQNVYREVNATRLLGELYSGEREYIKAQDVYTKGITLFNDEHDRIGLSGDVNVGRLFADLGDINYFITGDIDSALGNYETSIRMKNDTPSINYRVGAIRYNKKDYDSALSSFIKVSETNYSDPNLLIALANVLSLRGDNFAAQSYYSDLLRILDIERGVTTSRTGILFPQTKDDDTELVDMYLRANNNLGVTLYKLAKQTGNSNYYAESLVRFSVALRANDALTRDLSTMVRKNEGSLAASNSKYATHPIPDFEPEIYTEIPKILTDEKVLE